MTNSRFSQFFESAQTLSHYQLPGLDSNRVLQSYCSINLFGNSVKRLKGPGVLIVSCHLKMEPESLPETFFEDNVMVDNVQKSAKKDHYKNAIGKVKVALVQALRLCTGRTAHRGSRGIALLFHDQRH